MTLPFVARFTSISVHNWIVMQRVDRTPFNRSWEEFKVGFGSPDGNFWLRLEKVHKMTNSAPYKLRIEFMLQNGSWYSAEYDTFRVESESQYYRIHVGGFSGDLCDVMNIDDYGGIKAQNGMNFTTYDRDNDRYENNNCALHVSIGGGWWFNHCAYFTLNGVYGIYGFGVIFKGNQHQLSASRMMLKNN